MKIREMFVRQRPRCTVLLALCAIALGLVACGGEQPAPVVTMVVTDAPTEVLTEAPMPATSTLAPTFTPQSLPTHTPTAGAAIGVGDTPAPASETPPGVLYDEDFTSRSLAEQRGWVFDETEVSRATWEPDRLVLVVNPGDWISWRTAGASYADAGIEIEAQSIGAGYAEYGIVFRAGEMGENSQAYFFGLDTKGGYFVQKLVDGEWAEADPVAYTGSDAVNQGQAVNRLAVIADGAQITLFANGVQLVSIEDASIAEGRAGVFAASGETDQAGVVFPHLTVYHVDRAKELFGYVAQPPTAVPQPTATPQPLTATPRPQPTATPRPQPTSAPPPTSPPSQVNKGCYLIENQMGVELTFTFTAQDRPWSDTFKVPAGQTKEYCLDPGTYTYTIDAPPPWNSINGTLTVQAGDRYRWPVSGG